VGTLPLTDSHPIRRAFETKDPDAIAPLLAPGVVLYSPVTGARRFAGAQPVGELLRVLVEEYEGWTCLHELRSGDVHVLVTRASIGGRPVDVIDVLRHDEQGRVVELRVAARPMSSVAAFAAAVGPRLARRRSRLRAFAVRVAAAPLPRALAALDRLAAPIALPDTEGIP
jgi:hypothetical protein